MLRRTDGRTRVEHSESEQFYRKLGALIYLTHLSLDTLRSPFFLLPLRPGVNNCSSRYFYLRLGLFGRTPLYVHVMSLDTSLCVLVTFHPSDDV